MGDGRFRVHRILRVISLFLLVFSASCGGCFSGKDPKKSTKGKDPSLFKTGKQKIQRGVVSVTTMKVVFRDAPLSTTASGKADASERSQIKSPVEAKVQKVLVEEGSFVQSGDTLISFDGEATALKLSLARATQKEAEVAIGLIESGVSLPTEGRTPPESPESPDSNDETDTIATLAPPPKNQLEFFQAQLEKSKAEIELYENVAQEEKKIDSPFAGMITRKDVVDGAAVAQDQVLFEIARLDPMAFVFTAPLEFVPYLDHGADVLVSFDELPGQAFGKISATAESKGSGGSQVKIKLSNPDLSIRQDMVGTVRIDVSERRRVATIPEGALVRAPRASFVFLAEPTEDGKGMRAKKASVEALEAASGSVPVVKGLTEGDVIISSAEGGVDSLSDLSLIEVSP